MTVGAGARRILSKECSMPRMLFCQVGALVAIALIQVTAAAQGANASRSAPLTLPLRLSAWAVSMSNVATGRNAVLDIRITRWTTEAERAKLLATVVEDNPDTLMRALLKLPDSGRMRIPGHQGPDPMKVVLGWTLHYAWHAPLPEGGDRIVLATDRYITFAEARNQPRISDYPFTLVEIRLDKNGEGVGKASVATKISFDKKKNIMELENYSSEPVRLQQVKIER
jgi:hypothetical protein